MRLWRSLNLFKRLQPKLLAITAAGFFLCAPCNAHAQNFQQPTQEELTMTSDPKAPGADAIYLYYEDKADDGDKSHSFYVRLKILTEKGRDQAVIKLPYVKGEMKVKDIKARTIHPDGTVIPLNTKPSDLVESKSKGSQVKQLVFTFPDVTVGSILEYKLVYHFEESFVIEPDWDVQKEYFARKSHYIFRPDRNFSHYIRDYHGNYLNQLSFVYVLPPGVEVEVLHKGDEYELNLENTEPALDEDWSPPLQNFRYHVNFYYTYAKSADDYWKKEGDYWLNMENEFSKPSEKLKQAVLALVQNSESDGLKARKLYDVVMNFDNTDYERRHTASEIKKDKTQPNLSVDDVWNHKIGNSNDIAVLYAAMLNIVGVKASLVKVSSRDHTIFQKNYLDSRQLRDILVMTKFDGKDVVLDPGEKFCAFGLTNWTHYGTAGMRMSDDNKSTLIIGLNWLNYSKSKIARVANINLREDGQIDGTLQYVFEGPAATNWRQLLFMEGVDEVKKQFEAFVNDSIPEGVHGGFNRFLGVDEYNNKLIAFVNISGTLGTVTPKRYLLPADLFVVKPLFSFASQAKRFAPIDVHYPLYYSDEIHCHLPIGYKVESLPKTVSEDWPQHALLRMKAASDNDGVTVLRAFAYNYTVLPSNQYADLHDFFVKVASADQQQIVLTHTNSTTTPKTN